MDQETKEQINHLVKTKRTKTLTVQDILGIDHPLVVFMAMEKQQDNLTDLQFALGLALMCLANME